MAGKEDTEKRRWPGLINEAVIPKQKDQLKPGQLAPEKLKQYFEKARNGLQAIRIHTYAFI